MEHDSILAIEWFESNYMKLNQDKYHFLLSGHKHEVSEKIGHSKIWESYAQNLLWMITDRNLKFDEYILTQCKKLKHQQEFTLILVWNVEEHQWKLLFNRSVCIVHYIWMFCQRSSNNRSTWKSSWNRL